MAPTVHGLNILYPEFEWPNYTVPTMRLWDCGVAWRDIHIAPGKFDWTRLDLVIRIAESRGCNDFVYVACGTPEWLAADPDIPHYSAHIPQASNSKPSGYYEWRLFITALVKRYPQIKSVQIWNEPQLKDYWGYDNWTALAEMTVIAHRAIKEHNPRVRVLAAPVLPRMSSGGMKRASRYLQALKTRKWPVDVFTCHVYPEKDMGPLAWHAHINAVKSGLQRIGAPDKPLWVTETNYNLKAGPISEDAVVDYLRRTNLIANKTDVKRIYWYAYGTHTMPTLFGVRFTENSIGTHILRVLEDSRRRSLQRPTMKGSAQ